MRNYQQCPPPQCILRRNWMMMMHNSPLDCFLEPFRIQFTSPMLSRDTFDFSIIASSSYRWNVNRLSNLSHFNGGITLNTTGSTFYNWKWFQYRNGLMGNATKSVKTS